jgi:hypothetical protein
VSNISRLRLGWAGVGSVEGVGGVWEMEVAVVAGRQARERSNGKRMSRWRIV